MNVAYLLQRAGLALADRTAVALGTDRHSTYGQLLRRVAVIAGNLRHDLRLRPGDRGALIMKNCPHYVELLFACWHAGATAVPINAKLHPREFAFILGHSGARACFVTADSAETVASLQVSLPALERVICVEEADYAILGRGDPLAMAPTAADDVAWLFYTSGTTGRPKGAMLTHRNLMNMTASYLADVDRIDPGDSILHAAPMSHGSGMYILPHAAQGAAQVIPPGGGFEVPEVLDSIAAWPGLSMFAAPTMVKRLAEHPSAATADTGNLKTIVYGGGPMYLADLDKAHDVFGYKLAQIYGQGESPMTITALDKARHAQTDHPRHRERLASAGTAQLSVEVRVADADGTALPPGEVGEVLVRGDAVMRGYWQDPGATAAALRDGWLWTGDMGSMDGDGFLTLRDRSKDMIISGGSNIYPREVEEV
ncbi:MAG: AMP-binding protein, partial [Inquilinus sp.]|nr:AMP-binding protein [Inquilinus sp.]